MAITLSAKYLEAIRAGLRDVDVIVELTLDSGVKKLGFHRAFSDVAPVLKSVSSLQNKLDPKSGYASRGQMTFVIAGRDNFKGLVKDNYLKNRRVRRLDGFLGAGWAYADYAETYNGKVLDWSRQGDEITITVADDMLDTTKKIPVENATKTQRVDYRNMNPVDIMSAIFTELGTPPSRIDSTQFASERDRWFNGYKFDRVLTEPTAAKEYLNELQQETNSFIFHDGEKISLKAVMPSVPGQTIQAWGDKQIRHNSLSIESGYKDRLFNKIEVLYDYDESGGDAEKDFENVIIAANTDSQSAAKWDEVLTKTIKSKWIRSHTYSQPSNVTGATLYHASRNNGPGAGTLTYDATAQTLQWTPPGGSIGEAVKTTKDGKYQLFGADQTKYVRVIVVFASLPVSNQSDAITITALNAAGYAEALARRLLNYYGTNPPAMVSFDVDLADAAYNGQFVKPTDLKDLTTDEAFELGEETWVNERVMLTSIRPAPEDGIVRVEAIEAKWYRRYGYIAPGGQPDYPSATAAQREYAYIGDNSNKVNGGTEDGYAII